LGVLVAAAFTLRVIQVSFFGQTAPAAMAALAVEAPLPAITPPERLGAILLLAAAVAVGVYPDLLLDWIIPSLHSPLMRAAMSGGTP